jgi:hypothetical protein
LPHGQSQRFDEREENTVNKEHHKTKHSQCCRFSRSPNTAAAIIESYKLKTYRELREQKLKRRLQNEHPEPNSQGDELVLAEEGLSNSINDIICPVCLDPFHVGEEVTWSKLQHCRHTFHYECIIPWLVLGHVHCPVCREVFWSRHAQSEKDCVICIKLRRTLASRDETNDGSVLERSRFCVVHGLISPTTPHGVAE